MGRGERGERKREREEEREEEREGWRQEIETWLNHDARYTITGLPLYTILHRNHRNDRLQWSWN